MYCVPASENDTGDRNFIADFKGANSSFRNGCGKINHKKMWGDGVVECWSIERTAAVATPSRKKRRYEPSMENSGTALLGRSLLRLVFDTAAVRNSLNRIVAFHHSQYSSSKYSHFSILPSVSSFTPCRR